MRHNLESALSLPNAQSQARTRADAFFRWWLDFTPGYPETGNVEWYGYFVQAEVTRDDIRSYVAYAGDPWMSEHRNLEPGFYLIKVNGDGLIWAYQYASKAMARVDFDLLADVYGDYLDEVK